MYPVGFGLFPFVSRVCMRMRWVEVGKVSVSASVRSVSIMAVLTTIQAARMIRATRESSSLFVSFVDHRVLITRDLD